jgi:hypothetical protein
MCTHAGAIDRRKSLTPLAESPVSKPIVELGLDSPHVRARRVNYRSRRPNRGRADTDQER